MVRVEGLEPPRLAALEPKSSASTNSATPASEMRSNNPSKRFLLTCFVYFVCKLQIYF
jgi:hypothetical protein